MTNDEDDFAVMDKGAGSHWSESRPGDQLQISRQEYQEGRYCHACFLRYGPDRLTLKAVGARLGISVERTRQVIMRGLNRKLWLVDPTQFTLKYLDDHAYEMKRNGLRRSSDDLDDPDAIWTRPDPGTLKSEKPPKAPPWLPSDVPRDLSRDLPQFARALSACLDGPFVKVPRGTHNCPLPTGHALGMEPWKQRRKWKGGPPTDEQIADLLSRARYGKIPNYFWLSDLIPSNYQWPGLWFHASGRRIDA